jgi:phosphate-selective porin OprO/OprP
MILKTTTAALLATAAFGTFAMPALAQETAPAMATSSDEQASEIEFLKAQLEAMQAQIADLQKTSKNSAPTFKGAPLFGDKDAGWDFKIRGRFMQDAAFVSNPDDAVVTKNLGFNTRVRRVRLGVEGTLPGYFSYKSEMDFANSSVGFGDVILTWTPSNGPFSITVGNHETFESLEQVSSSRWISFLERAQMNDAFGHTRRLGLSFGYASKSAPLRLNAGIFTNHSIDSSLDNDGWIGAARLTYTPQVAGGLVHVGANYQHRENSSTALQSRYRARPGVTTTDIRFVDTGAFVSKSDDVFGVELAGVFGPFHGAAEAQWVKTKGYRPGYTFTKGDSAGGATIFSASNPDFFSWYAEVGYFLTGESRGYKNGVWDRTKVKNPVSKGGMGAFQINARYDHLDLQDAGLQAGGVGTSLARGGEQDIYQASLIWIPIDYVRFLLQYSRAEVTGGPLAAAVKPLSAKPIDERSYGVDSVAVRAQFDF